MLKVTPFIHYMIVTVQYHHHCCLEVQGGRLGYDHDHQCLHLTPTTTTPLDATQMILEGQALHSYVPKDH